jgi:signal transduction histidine kinase
LLHRVLAQTILDSVVDAILVFDSDTGEIHDVNRGASILFERPLGSLVGRRLDEFLEPAAVARLSGPFRTTQPGERGVETVLSEVHLGGDRSISVEFVAQPVELPGGGRGVVAIARDIGERLEVHVRLQRLAQAEHARAAELNAVISAMGEAVVVCEADGTIRLTNPAAHRMFPDVDERSYGDILAELHDPGGTAPRLRAADGPVELPTRRNHDRWVEIATYPVNDRLGNASGAQETIVVMRDVTEARHREAVRETFIGILSHELRTPVTTIFGGAKLLAREPSTLDEETKRGIFRDIHTEAERLQRLVEDVVALNRFGEGAGEISWEPVLLQRLVPRVVDSEQDRWPGVTYAVDIASGLPTVSADATYVEQVIRNLLSNAAKYSGAGSTVTITATATDDEVQTRILDDGPGFPAAEAARLFELFYRSPGTAGAAGGAGIGLFVCARLVAAMGGRIWAVPRPEGGAEFGFALKVLHE